MKARKTAHTTPARPPKTGPGGPRFHGVFFIAQLQSPCSQECRTSPLRLRASTHTVTATVALSETIHKQLGELGFSAVK